MHVEVCYFADGQHYGPRGCYHEQFPEEYPPGWNVQLQERADSHPYWDGTIPDETGCE
ncbi:hypothetical protein ACWDTT_33255 [Streptosporangium sandarakinum]